MFILLAQNEPKGQPITWPAKAGYPALLENIGRCETRFAQTVGVYAITWLRLPLALFRYFVSANILLPTIDGTARLREMAF